MSRDNKSIPNTIHLVRLCERMEAIEVLVDSSLLDILPEMPDLGESRELANLWDSLLKEGIVPTFVGEFAEGIEMFHCDYDPVKHSGLMHTHLGGVVGEATRTGRVCSEVPSRTLSTALLRIERVVKENQIKRFAIELETGRDISTVNAEDIWWERPDIEFEIDEQDRVEVSLQIENGAESHRFPFVALQEAMLVVREPPCVDSSAYTPSSIKEVDHVESEWLQGILRPEPNRCYFNARRSIRSLPGYCDTSYVEGFVVTDGGGVLEHGWIVKDGRIVESTTLKGKNEVYFPGLEFRGREVIQSFLWSEAGRQCHGHPFHFAFGFGSPTFKDSFCHAVRALHDRYGEDAVFFAKRYRKELGLPWSDDWS